MDLLEAIEGPLTASVPSNGSLAEHTLAKLQKLLDDVAASKRRELGQISLADLLPPTEPDDTPSPRSHDEELDVIASRDRPRRPMCRSIWASINLVDAPRRACHDPGSKAFSQRNCRYATSIATPF